MNPLILMRLLAADHIFIWPDLARDLERRTDTSNAAEALQLLHTQGYVAEAAQWLARLTDTPELHILRTVTLAHAEDWPTSPLRALAKDLLSGAYRLIPAGSFLMGSPDDEDDSDDNEDQDEDYFDDKEDQREVEITRPFLLKTTPVTQAEWQAFMGDNPSEFKGDDLRPVEMVSWFDAVRFCDALSTKTGGAYRLPTEAQWEYACRAGTTAALYGDIDAVANWKTPPVAQKQPNAWGLYDMLGSVWEWCLDWEADYSSEPLRDPQGPPSGSYRMIRGGNWYSYVQNCRAALRSSRIPTDRYDSVGFRPVCLLD